MKKIFLLIAPLLTFHFCLFTFTSPVSAKVMMQEKGTITIPSGEIIDDDLFVAAENVNIDGTVTGDVFVGAGTIKVSGNIKGGLFAGTGDLSLMGASVANSVIAGAGNILIDRDSKIGGSLIVGAGSVKNYAPVGRNIMAGAGTILLDGKVGKEVRVGGGNVELGPKSAISGNLTYALGDDESTLKQDDQATVAGSVTRFTPPRSSKQDINKMAGDFNKFGRMAGRGWLIVSFLGSLLIGFIILRLFPKTSVGLAQEVTSNPTSALGVGFLIIIAIIPALLVLAITVVGLPLAGLVFLLFSVKVILAKLVASYALGMVMVSQFNWKKMGIYTTFAVGLAIFSILRAIPAVGWLVSIVFTWTGLGAIWLYTKSHLKSL